MQETQVQSLGWEDLLEKEMATHSHIFAWRIPWTEEPGGLQSMGSQGVGCDRATEQQQRVISQSSPQVWLNTGPKLTVRDQKLCPQLPGKPDTCKGLAVTEMGRGGKLYIFQQSFNQWLVVFVGVQYFVSFSMAF